MPSPAGEEGEQAGRLSRRQFARASVKAGMAAGAAVWVAPQLSSVALAETAPGSPPPSTAPPDGGGAGEPLPPGQASGSTPTRGTAGTGGSGAPGAGAGTGGALPMTGADVRKLAATGGAALAGGSALVGVERLTRRRRPLPAPDVEAPNNETGR